MGSVFREQVFNELSTNGCYQTIEDACAGMNRFCDVLKYVSDAGMKFFYISNDFSNFELCDKFTIQNWRINKSVDKSKIQLFLTKATKNPYIETVLDEQYKDVHLLKDIRFENNVSLGLKLAFFKQTNVLSMDGNKQFQSETIPVTENEFSDDSISELQVEIPSVCNCKQAYNRLYNSITNGKELVEARSLLFFNLLFADNAIKQLLDLHGNERYFREILEHLKALNTGILNYQLGVFLPEPNLDFTNESESTQSNKDFRRKRTFMCADGMERVFTYHSKIRSDNKRIYFEPDLLNHIVHIGYVGDHLPTTQFAH